MLWGHAFMDSSSCSVYCYDNYISLPFPKTSRNRNIYYLVICLYLIMDYLHFYGISSFIPCSPVSPRWQCCQIHIGQIHIAMLGYSSMNLRHDVLREYDLFRHDIDYSGRMLPFSPKSGHPSKLKMMLGSGWYRSTTGKWQCAHPRCPGLCRRWARWCQRPPPVRPVFRKMRSQLRFQYLGAYSGGTAPTFSCPPFWVMISSFSSI